MHCAAASCGVRERFITMITSLKNAIGTETAVKAYVHKIRKASGLTFVTLRYGRYMLQAVYIPDLCKTPISEMCEGAYIDALATVTEEKRSEYGFELTLKSFAVLSKPECEMPITSSQPTLREQILHRSISVKYTKERDILTIRSAMEYAYIEFMQSQGFISINTPKIVASHNNDEYISVKYFDKNGALASSSDALKIIAAGGLDKVYEVGAGYCKRNSNSTRHLNEYTRLDFELSYGTASDVRDILKNAVCYIDDYIIKNYPDELKRLEISPDKIQDIPSMTYADALKLLGKSPKQQNLDPTDEKKLSLYAKENFNSSIIFITDIPPKKHHIYESENSGFVLLFDGIEIASGGEHITEYSSQLKRFTELGLNPDEYENVLSAQKYALPPMGGATIGLERLAMAYMSLSDIREAVFIVRDMHHITP